jgi:hypothetical protein
MKLFNCMTHAQITGHQFCFDIYRFWNTMDINDLAISDKLLFRQPESLSGMVAKLRKLVLRTNYTCSPDKQAMLQYRQLFVAGLDLSVGTDTKEWSLV